MHSRRKPSALKGALVVATAIASVAAFAGGLLYIDKLIGGPLLSAATPALASSTGDGSFPADADILNILKRRIDDQAQSVGIVVGTIGPEGRNILAHGRFSAADQRPVDGNTLYEIGSITKLFTALVLADMDARGELRLDDPLARHLPSGVSVPGKFGAEITLADLATHRSGLPSIPETMAPTDDANPYADYTTAQLYEFLSSYTLPRAIGAKYEYSNIGFGLLGDALAHRAGVDYATLVRQRITGPLGMNSTVIALSPELKARMAGGHNSWLEPVPNWDLPALEGAGALRSSANDMLNFLDMAIEPGKRPLAAALASSLVPRNDVIGGSRIGLAWMLTDTPNGQVVWHNGGTGGFSTFIGFNPKTKAGVVVLSNSDAGVNDIGMHLLDAAIPLDDPKPRPKQVSVDAALFDGYVGRYAAMQGLVFTISRDGDKLYAQLTGQPRLRLFPESERRFFYKEVDAAITFAAGDGSAPSLTLHQSGQDLPAVRVQE